MNAFTAYAYDKNGNLTGITYPSGRQATFTINTSDQVTAASATVNGASATLASAITYEPFGPHASMTFGNGLADARSFDTRYRLGTWTLGGLISKTYAWQDDDNITGITDNLNSANNRNFGYDAIHRLTTASGPWGAGSYSYDSNGNRQSKTEGASNTTYAYTAGTNRLATATGSEPATYGYDANGNTTSDGTHTYQYSQRDRLATVDTGTTATYGYDGDGRRVKKVASGVTTLYFYDPDGKLLEEYIPATGAGKDYVWLPGTYEPLARVDFSMSDADNGNVLRVTKSSPNVHLDWSLDGTSGPFVLKRSLSFTFSNPVYLGPGQTTKTFDDGVLNNGQSYAYEAFRRTLTDTLYFYHDDHLGTPIAMTDTSGALVWRAEHTPFGGIYALTVGTITNNFRFPGQYFDGETGLAQNYFRDYNNRTGRYWEPDQIRISPTFAEECFVYGKNNPIRSKDPRGLCTSDMDCLACIVYAEAGGAAVPDACKIAVAWTVKNRVGKSGYGDTSSICSTVKDQHQFNASGNSRYNGCCAGKCGNKQEQAEADKIRTLIGALGSDPTGGATFFQNAGCCPNPTGNAQKVSVPGCPTFDFFK
jgi:RHS repeat-associated protein